MKRPFIIVLLAAIAMLIPFQMSKQSPQAKAANAILDRLAPLHQRMSKPGGLNEVEWFFGKLKAINTAGAPEEVQRAMTVYITAVEANWHVRRQAGDTNAANERVVAAKRDLMRALNVARGEPF